MDQIRLERIEHIEKQIGHLHEEVTRIEARIDRLETNLGCAPADDKLPVTLGEAGKETASWR